MKKLRVALKDVYEYVKWMYTETGEIQNPIYRCRFCFAQAERPKPVVHADGCPIEII